MNLYHLIALPCGCVNHVDDIVCDGYWMECSWCKAGFSMVDYNKWFAAIKPVMWLSRPPLKMLLCGELLLEIVEQEGDNLMVRAVDRSIGLPDFKKLSAIPVRN